MRLHRRQRGGGVTPPDPGGEWRRLLGPPPDNSIGVPRPATARLTGAPVDRPQLRRADETTAHLAPCTMSAITWSTISSRRLGIAALRPKPTPGSGPYCVHALRRRCVSPQQAFVFQLRPERRRNRVTECGNVLPHVLGRQAAGNHRGDRGMAQRELQRRRRETPRCQHHCRQ